MPELLAPAGDWECVRAAVENGADALYFGLDRFNARMRAENFTAADLPRLMEFLHGRGVRGYLAFNTLVFTDELAEAERFLRQVIAAGVDGVIVQDVGLCRLIRQLSPDFPIHASTQMTITSRAGLEFARALGCQRVVLARECSIREIERLREPAEEPTGFALPVEVFVHGALCVAYSGQCLTSEALGGRSANRGECAQACRLPYDLIADGKAVPLGDRRYLLSPQDLAGLDVLPELARLGVSSLKIEGRLKSAAYVANITRIYREALDALEREGSGVQEGTPGGGGRAGDRSKRRVRYEMEMAFSRGLYTGWFGGVNNQELVHARFPKKRGVYLGEVLRVVGDRVHVRLEGPLKPGDGVVFDAGRPDEPEQGGRVYELRSARTGKREAGGAAAELLSGGEVILGFGRGDLDLRQVQAGQKLWKTSDPELDRRLRQTYAGEAIRFQRPLHLRLQGRAGEPLTMEARDDHGHAVRLISALPLAAAANQPLTADRLREQFGRLGGTPFRLGRLEVGVEGRVMLPLSELNRLRRAVVQALEAQRRQPRRWTLREAAPGGPTPGPGPTGLEVLDRTPGRALSEVEGEERGLESAGPLVPELILLLRSLPQLEAALTTGVSTLYCELEDPKRYREAVALVRARRDSRSAASPEAGAVFRPTLYIVPPRITKPGEEWMLRQVRAADADGYLVRNHDQLGFFAGCRCVGDYSLNVANPLAAEHYLRRYGLERVTASYDLNGAQLEALLQAAPPAWFEITLHQHMPMFHMEHCVFCAFLSSGTDYTNCGRPCDRHEVHLRDRTGARHPVKADAGCRNTVYNARAQTGAEYVGRFAALGARHFRVEFLEESPEQVTRTVAMYRQLLRGEVSGATVWRELKLCHQLGVTRGTLDRGARPITVL